MTTFSGTVDATYTFDAYGRQIGKTGTASTPLGFAGEYTDAESGLLYLRARYLDPTTGQFLTSDPLVAVTGSPYGYTMGNPLNGLDPSGLFSFRNAFAVVGAVAGVVAIGAAVVALSPFEVAGAVGAGVAFSLISLVGSIGVTAADCRKAVDANCVTDGVLAAIAAGSFGLGGAAASAGSCAFGEVGNALKDAFEIFGGALTGVGGIAGLLGLRDPHSSAPNTDSPSTPPATYPPGPGYTGSSKYVDENGVPHAP